MKLEESVPKRRHIKFRAREIISKETVQYLDHILLRVNQKNDKHIP